MSQSDAIGKHKQEILVAGNPRYKGHAFREATELEQALLKQAHGPQDIVLARLAGSLMLAVRSWHWRRMAKRKVAGAESADLAAHTNALLRILERFESAEPANTPTSQTSGPTSGDVKPVRPPWVKPADCVCQPGARLLCQPCVESRRAFEAERASQ